MMAVLAVLAVLALIPTASKARAAGALLSVGKAAAASSVENGGTPAAAAFDGNLGTRWSSANTDPQWIQVNLGQKATIDQITLNWEAASSKAFRIEVSDTGTGGWTQIYSTTTGAGGNVTLPVSGAGQYVRLTSTARNTVYGISLWEFGVYGAFGGGDSCSTTNAALNKASAASSVLGGNTAAMAFDANTTGTRWESVHNVDPQWVQVNLGSSQSICKVVLNWEGAYGKAYTIETSATGAAGSWTALTGGTVTTGDGGMDTLTVSGSGQYVRMFGTVRGNGYGYSLWDFQVFTGTGGGGGGGGVCAPQPTVPNFGPNVRIYDPSMSTASIQASLNEVFEAQKSTNDHQFHLRRDALLFKPGNYGSFAAGSAALYANIGFNTSIQGLAQNPTGTTINGAITVDAFNASDAGNATQNFWRSAENMTINTNGGRNRWGVSQAAPFRRMKVVGGLDLFPASYGWSSGGYISDTRVSGSVESASQQQWYSLQSNFGSWSGSNWNMVFSGVAGAPPTNFSTDPAGLHHTNLATTPVSRDVPYIYLDGANYRLFLPSLRTNASGASWSDTAPTPGTSVSFSSVFVARPSDTTEAIQAALDGGCNIVFTPGVYHVNKALNVSKANTVMLGMGYATIIPDGGVSAITIGDVDGVRIKGMFIDAGTTNSASLLTVGTPAGVGVSRAANPVTIQDVFFRIGGSIAGKASVSLTVNSSDTVVDHIWAWRADHGNPGTYGWTINTADTGVVVNGNNVLATGLFVEHYQKYEVIWNGQGGRIIFFQNEKPYDPPNQAAWMNGTKKGYAAIKVADAVNTFDAIGLGSYVVFTNDNLIANFNSYESPVKPGIKWTNMANVSLGGQGVINTFVNGVGPQADRANPNRYLISYP